MAALVEAADGSHVAGRKQHFYSRQLRHGDSGPDTAPAQGLPRTHRHGASPLTRPTVHEFLNTRVASLIVVKNGTYSFWKIVTSDPNKRISGLK